MFSPRRKVAAGVGAAVIAGTAGLVAIAPSASAGTVTPTFSCVTLLGTSTGAISVSVELTPDNSPAGADLQAVVDLGAPPVTSPLAFDNVVSTTRVEYTWGGTASGTGVMVSPTTTISIPAGPAPDIPAFTAIAPVTIPAGATPGGATLTVTKFINKVTIPGFGDQEQVCTVTGGNGPAETITVKAPPAPATAVVAPTTIQQGSGGTVTGTGWEGAISGVDLCAGATCQPYPVNTIAVGSGGALTGGFTIVDQVPPGAYTLKITSDSGQIASTNTFTVTGVPPVTAATNPTSGDLGAATTVSGTNWPAGNVTVQGLKQDNTPTTDAPVTVPVAADGTFSTPYTVNDANTRKIGVTNGTKNATAAYTVKVGQQVTTAIEGEVIGGGLNFQQAGTGITLTPITLNGKPQTMNGSLNQVKVQDFRGTTLGWDLTGQITDFTSPAVSGVISGDRFTWTPACAVTNPDSPSQVVTGSAGTVGALCSQTANAPGQVSGGEFTADAATKLAVPAWQLSGTYTATLTLTLI
ncbi:hypothetical protein OG216_18360 [Streptomycetaceae bacterium NBC_01309]